MSSAWALNATGMRALCAVNYLDETGDEVDLLSRSKDDRLVRSIGAHRFQSLVRPCPSPTFERELAEVDVSGSYPTRNQVLAFRWSGGTRST